MKQGEKRLTKYLSYSAIGFGTSLLTIAVNTYVMYYYTDVLLLPLGLISVLLFVCRFFDGVIDPFIGFYMDRRHTRFGKYKGYIVFWVLPVCIFHAAMFLPPRLTGTALAAYCFIIYLLWALSHSVIECAHRPMLITLNDNPEQRRMANTVNIAVNILGALAASYLPLVLVEKLGGGSERRGFSLAMILFAVIAFAAMLPGSLKLKERNAPRDNALSLKRTVGELIHNKKLIILVAMYLCCELASSVKAQSFVYYMKYNLDRADLTAAIMLTGVLSSFLTQPLIFLASKRVNTITLMMWGFIVTCLAVVVIGISGQSIALLFAGNILYGVASAFPANLVFVYTADLAESLSRQNSVGGFVTSLLSVAARAGQALSSLIISAVMYATGYVPNVQQTPAALAGIWGCLTILTFAALAAAAVMAGLSRRMDRVH